MEIIINILLISVFINTILKISFWDFKFQLIVGVLVGGFVLLTYDIATEQSKTQIDQWLENSDILGNMAVLITIEAMLYMSFCFLSLKDIYEKQKGWVFIILRLYSGVLIFPVSLYIFTQSVFYFTGVDFFSLAMIMSFIMALLVVGFSFGVKKLLPEREMRLEMLFIVSLIVTTLGLISTTNGKMMYPAKNEAVDLPMLGVTFVLFGAFFVVGYLITYFKWKYFNKTKK